ncbi:hypothetical protein DSM106972_000420 [Dulcicalothrix desertica PCC 7102]|uniref:SD-repeat containing protein B domain-containing protein n=1 Tax=Dulcicalothrix desertica PCC 7102 TaxID=232991 RepID=A0A3S1AUP2_9CYAN|nr:SdrD B-like domain-containing protein [Dulcicalothrix desertica]RUT09548.1 hypothetical protein DSM106972_000420 [Dulcicalothrix desertica PCC 7102]TWH50744.1 putative repeat protein (TIGR01451 family) [Dulcicalothrix desertica PCC 7102]
MKAFFKRTLLMFNSGLHRSAEQPLKVNRKWQKVLKSLRYYFLALLLAVTQIVFSGGMVKQKVIAQTQNLCPAGDVPTPVNWRPAVGAPAISAQTINVGEVAVSFEFAETVPGQVIDNVETRIDNDVYGGIPGPNLRFNIGQDKTPSPGNATLSINFSRPVIIASPLTILDVDRDGERDIGFTYQDRVTVTAFNGDVPVGVALRSLTPNTRVTGNTVVGINENSFPDRPDANASATPAGQLNRIDLLYEPGTEFGQPRQDETIGLARFSICLPAPPGATIGDTVFNDRNSNGRQDEGEPGIANVTLILRNSRGQEVRRTTTNSNGIYSFTTLPLGNFTVEALRPNNDFNPTTNTTLPANLTEPNQSLLTVDFGFNTNRLGAAGAPNIRLIKRITGATRNGQPISGINFNTFVGDPNNNNDDELPSPERFRGVSTFEAPVQSRDEIEYTVYFLAEGNDSSNNVRFCDLVPNGTTFANNSININGAGSGADSGRYLTPLAPLEAFTNICSGSNNNGAVVANLGNIPSGNFGFVRFRVGIN